MLEPEISWLPRLVYKIKEKKKEVKPTRIFFAFSIFIAPSLSKDKQHYFTFNTV